MHNQRQWGDCQLMIPNDFRQSQDNYQRFWGVEHISFKGDIVQAEWISKRTLLWAYFGWSYFIWSLSHKKGDKWFLVGGQRLRIIDKITLSQVFTDDGNQQWGQEIRTLFCQVISAKQLTTYDSIQVPDATNLFTFQGLFMVLLVTL